MMLSHCHSDVETVEVVFALAFHAEGARFKSPHTKFTPTGK